MENIRNGAVACRLLMYTTLSVMHRRQFHHVRKRDGISYVEARAVRFHFDFSIILIALGVITHVVISVQLPRRPIKHIHAVSHYACLICVRD